MAEEKNDLILESGPTEPMIWNGFDQRQLIIPDDATDEELVGLVVGAIRDKQLLFCYTEEGRDNLPEPYCNWELEK